jgi:hypothetical protein
MGSYPLKAPEFRTYGSISPFKFNSMKHMHAFHLGEETTLAAIIAVLYFCSIMLFAYVFTLT